MTQELIRHLVLLQSSVQLEFRGRLSIIDEIFFFLMVMRLCTEQNFKKGFCTFFSNGLFIPIKIDSEIEIKSDSKRGCQGVANTKK